MIQSTNPRTLRTQARTTFIVQHILTNYDCMVDRIKCIDEDDLLLVYHSSSDQYEISIQVGSDPEMVLTLYNQDTKEIVLSKDFKEYNFLAEAFKYFKIPFATTPNERTPNDHQEEGILTLL